MEIPDRLSDMDSIPETISLRESEEAARVGMEASIADFAETLPRLGESIVRLAESLARFSQAVEVADLEDIYRLNA